MESVEKGSQYRHKLKSSLLDETAWKWILTRAKSFDHRVYKHQKRFGCVCVCLMFMCLPSTSVFGISHIEFLKMHTEKANVTTRDKKSIPWREHYGFSSFERVRFAFVCFFSLSNWMKETVVFFLLVDWLVSMLPSTPFAKLIYTNTHTQWRAEEF